MRCVWYMLQVWTNILLFVILSCLLHPIKVALLWELQNDLVHGWGLDFALRKCVYVSDLPLFFLAFRFLL